MILFDFAANWADVKPHLKHPSVRRALNEEMRRYASLGNYPYDPKRGPWTMTSSDYWVTRITDEAERHPDAPQWPFIDDNPAPELEEAYMRVWSKFEEQFAPKPDTYQWYQAYGLCHYLARWEAALGRRMFPELQWQQVHSMPTQAELDTGHGYGQHHGCAIGFKDNKPEMIFDILEFEHSTPKKVLARVCRR